MTVVTTIIFYLVCFKYVCPYVADSARVLCTFIRLEHQLTANSVVLC